MQLFAYVIVAKFDSFCKKKVLANLTHTHTHTHTCAQLLDGIVIWELAVIPVLVALAKPVNVSRSRRECCFSCDVSFTRIK